MEAFGEALDDQAKAEGFRGRELNDGLVWKLAEDGPQEFKLVGHGG